MTRQLNALDHRSRAVSTPPEYYASFNHLALVGELTRANLVLTVVKTRLLSGIARKNPPCFGPPRPLGSCLLGGGGFSYY